MIDRLIKIGFFSGALLCSFCTIAQQKVQEDSVETIKQRLIELDTTITAEELLPYSQFVQENTLFNPSELDKISRKLHSQNEQGNYEESLKLATELLSYSPNNITGLKEKSFAFKNLGMNDSWSIYFSLMVTAIKTVLLSGDGGYRSPILVNNSFELYSIIEASYRLSASQSGVLKSTSGEIRAFYKVGSISLFGYINHWEPFLKRGQFVEVDIDMDEINRTLEMDSILESLKE